MSLKKLALVVSMLALPAVAWTATRSADCGCSLGGECHCGANCHCKH